MIRCGCELAARQGARATSNELQKSTTPIVAGEFGESRSIQVLERQAFGENAQKTDKEAMHRKQEQVVDVATPSSQRRPPPVPFPFSESIVSVRFVSSARSAGAFVLAYNGILLRHAQSDIPPFRALVLDVVSAKVEGREAGSVSSLLAESRFVASRPGFEFAGASGRA